MAAFIKIKLHGLIKEVIGKEKIEMDAPKTGLLADLLKQLIRLYPELAFETVEDMANAYLFLVDSQVVMPSYRLAENDEVSVFSFVDGG